MEGSVDEESTKSDEEYDDLAMKDGYSSDDDEEPKTDYDRLTSTTMTETSPGKLIRPDESFQKLRRCYSHSDRNRGNKEERNRNRSRNDILRVRSRSHSIPASFFGEQPILQVHNRGSSGQISAIHL